jgi:hypothetical protein
LGLWIWGVTQNIFFANDNASLSFSPLFDWLPRSVKMESPYFSNNSDADGLSSGSIFNNSLIISCNSDENVFWLVGTSNK